MEYSEQQQNNLQEQENELEALQAIFPEGLHIIKRGVLEQGKYDRRIMMEVALPLPEDLSQIEVAIVKDQGACSNQESNSLPCCVKYLPPLLLHLKFPISYPSDEPPEFNISSSWLDLAKLGRLCRKLDEMWQKSEPVVFNWVDWLENNALLFLALKKIELISETAIEDHDTRAVLVTCSPEEALLSIVRYDFEKEGQVFIQSSHMCDICFEEKPGKRFFRLDCRHFFCRDCVTDYCNVNIQDGTVLQIKCLRTDCDQMINPWIVRAAVGEAEFQRYDSLALQRSLDTMHDVEWCPRCNQPVISDENKSLNLAMCPQCKYAFCTECYESWHQGEACSSLLSANLSSLEKEASSKERRKKLQKLAEAQASNCLMRKTTKPCPSCKAPIEKNMGCNKVTCTVCFTKMCYCCGKAIEGYEHFERKCNLFDPILEDRGYIYQRQQPMEAIMIQIQLDEYPDAWDRLVVCVRCKQRCLRNDNNNHVRCWNCKVNYCCACKKIIVGSVGGHYLPPNPCKQHS